MKITFRLECPFCNWGTPWSDGYVNMGWIKLICGHCSEEFYVKIAINDINVEISKELPPNVVCQGIPKGIKSGLPKMCQCGHPDWMHEDSLDSLGGKCTSAIGCKCEEFKLQENKK
jgi:hypothetical protein